MQIQRMMRHHSNMYYILGDGRVIAAVASVEYTAGGWFASSLLMSRVEMQKHHGWYTGRIDIYHI